MDILIRSSMRRAFSSTSLQEEPFTTISPTIRSIRESRYLGPGFNLFSNAHDIVSTRNLNWYVEGLQHTMFRCRYDTSGTGRDLMRSRTGYLVAQTRSACRTCSNSSGPPTPQPPEDPAHPPFGPRRESHRHSGSSVHRPRDAGRHSRTRWFGTPSEERFALTGTLLYVTPTPGEIASAGRRRFQNRF